MKYDAYRHLISGIYGHLFERRFQFLAGDQPSATTLSNWALQDAFAIDAIESIIGDLRGASKEGGGSNLGSIYFTNLSRAIGNLALLSGWMPSMTDSGTGLPKTFWVVEPIPSGYNEISLSFYGVVMDPSMVPVFGYMDGETFTPYSPGTWVYQNDREDLKLANEFTLNGNKLIFKDHSPIPTPPAVQNAIRYYGMALSPFELEGKDGCLIPSLAQCIISHPVTGSNIPDMLCKVTEGAVVSGYQEYTLEIPEIRHLLYRSDFSQYASDISFVLTRGQKYKIFPIPQQTVSLRYPLPKWLTSVVRDVDDFAQVEGTQNIVAENLLPTGTILLWNILTDEPAAYTGESDTFDKSEIQFAYIDETHLKVRIPAASKLIKKIENGAISYITTGDASTFALVVKGTDLAKEVFDIKTTLMFKPESLNFLAYYPHSGIGKSFRGADASSPAEVGSTYHKYYQSVDEANFHPQYLEKGGYVQGSDPLNRDGAFLGDYCLALDGDTYPQDIIPIGPVGPKVTSYSSTQAGTYRSYWGYKDRLFDQYRELYGRTTQGGSAFVYSFLHHGSEAPSNIIGAHQRYDWALWTKGTIGRYWVAEFGDSRNRTDLPTDTEACLSVWGVPWHTNISHFRHLSGLRYPEAGGLMAKVFSLTDGNLAPKNAYLVAGGARWFNQGDDVFEDEEGGGFYTRCRLTTPSKGAWGFAGVRRKTGEFLDEFGPLSLMADGTIDTGLPYKIGMFYGATKTASLYTWWDDTEGEAASYSLLHSKSDSTGSILFGSILWPGSSTGFDSAVNYGLVRIPIYNQKQILGIWHIYAKAKIFGVLDMSFDPDADYGSGEDFYKYGDIQFLGHFAVRGTLVGANRTKRGQYERFGTRFSMGSNPFYTNGGAVLDTIDDSFLLQGETQADWALSVNSDSAKIAYNARMDINGPILAKVVKAQFGAGQASRVERPYINNEAGINPSGASEEVYRGWDLSGDVERYIQPVIVETARSFYWTVNQTNCDQTFMAGISSDQWIMKAPPKWTGIKDAYWTDRRAGWILVGLEGMWIKAKDTGWDECSSMYIYWSTEGPHSNTHKIPMPLYIPVRGVALDQRVTSYQEPMTTPYGANSIPFSPGEEMTVLFPSSPNGGELLTFQELSAIAVPPFGPFDTNMVYRWNYIDIRRYPSHGYGWDPAWTSAWNLVARAKWMLVAPHELIP